MTTNPRRAAAALMLALLTCAAPSVAAQPPERGVGAWDLEIGGGLLLFSPEVERIPRGTSDTAVQSVIDVSAARRVVNRLSVRLSAAYARGSEFDWRSAQGGGTAVIPTPDVWSAFVALEAPLVLGIGPVVPLAGIGAGVVAFGEVNEAIRFGWGTHVTTNRIRFAGHVDPGVLFELGAAVALSPRISLVSRYRFLTVFDGPRVDTLDRATLSARVRW